jgi:NAD+ synthase (glutamine-hydrolysing)
MNIAIAQLNYTVSDIEANKEKIISSIEKAKSQGVKLITFAEYAISGCPCYDLLQKASFLVACEDAAKEIAEHCTDISALVGMPILVDGHVLSAIALMQHGKIVRYIGKKNVSSRMEASFLSTSEGSEYVNIDDCCVSVVVGDDILVERDFGKRTDLIIVLSSNPFARGQIQTRYSICKEVAYVAARGLIYVNHAGGQSDFVYDGSSFALNAKGEFVAFLKNFEEDYQIVNVDTAPPVAEPEQDKTLNTYKAIKLGLADYFRKNGFKKACVGLSGGIDSAVVMALAVEVLGAENVKALLMPSQFSTDHSVSDAVEMCENLGVEYEIIPIKEAYDAINNSLQPILANTSFDTTEENIQSRIRCVMLMAQSNKHGHILLNTSNKSEAAVGYGTLYGDCSGSIGPIGDLYKIEVYSLARLINRDKTMIPVNIINKAPSAELRPGQMDSDSLPQYDILDAILYRFVDEGQDVEEIIGAGFDEQTVHKILNMVNRAEYKRRQAAPPLKLSQRPFSTNFIMPLLNKIKI